MTYNFTLKKTVGKFEVQIDPVAQYGFFEHEDYGDEYGGGLWFVGTDLVDYDGVAILPAAVIEACTELGMTVGEEFAL
jgi:hypothetical protein